MKSHNDACLTVLALAGVTSGNSGCGCHRSGSVACYEGNVSRGSTPQETAEGLSAKRPKCVGETSDPCRRNVSGSKSLSAKRLSAKRLIGETSAPQTAKIHRFVRFVMYCIITTCSVKCYWHCSDGTVHYKSDKMVNFCCFRCAITSPITVFTNIVFYIYNSVISQPWIKISD